MSNRTSKGRRGAAIAAAFIAAVLAAAGVAAAAMLESQASVGLHDAPDHLDVGRALTLLRFHDPRRATAGAVRTLHLGERDLDLLLNHAARRWIDLPTRVRLQAGAATVDASMQVPDNPFGGWLNVQARWTETAGLPALAGWRVGRLPLPAWLGERVGAELLRRAGLSAEVQLAGEVVRRVSFAPQQLRVVYAWQPDSAGRAVGALVPAAELERLRAYHQRLVELAAAQTAASPALSLATWIGPLFELARQRSANLPHGNGDAAAAAENRAALIVLTLFVTGRSAASLSPAAASWPPLPTVPLTLAGREDFPQHLLVSAAVAAEGSGPLSRALGLYKEVADSRRGSGFSFNDIALDRAGTRLGELAVARPRQLQALLARGVDESALLPAVADLPEFMTEAEFKRRFGGVGEPAYEALIAEIDRRVAALPALR